MTFETFLNDEQMRKRLAKMIALQCFRNTKLEDLHAGISPSSKAGDYSDVSVESPYGKIEWAKLSRFNDEEMKELMIDVVNRTYTLLCNMADRRVRNAVFQALAQRDVEPRWNEPQTIQKAKTSSPRAGVGERKPGD
jgi:hypothetical protein